MAEGVAAGPRVYTVGEVVGGVRRMLEDRVGRLWVAGEVRDLSRPRSGHVYFNLADDAGQLRAALFRADARRVAFEPEEGLEVIAYGDLTVYEQRGDLQLVVRQLEPRGVGALQLAFEQLRRRLEAEGLFDPADKREPPGLPGRIGVVTSPSGAALRDVLEVTGRRWPSAPILVSPTRVQGPGADAEIVRALAALTEAGRHALHDPVSVVLLVRGGGSLEDLQAFNSEAVARAIRACPVPVIVGVGHESDVTIADLAADLRAPTPSAAAEQAVPDRRALGDVLRGAFEDLAGALGGRLERAELRVDRAAQALRAHAPAARLRFQRQRLGAAARALLRAGGARPGPQRERFAATLRALLAAARDRPERRRARLATAVRALLAAGRSRPERSRRRLGEAAARLEGLSPLAVLGRGYGLVRRAEDGGIVRGPGDVEVGQRIDVTLDRARLVALVERLERREPGGDR